MTVVTDYTAILATNDDPDARWNNGVPLQTGAVVTYSFVSGGNLPGRDELYYDATGASALTAAQRASFRKATEEYAKETGLIFVEVPNGRPAMIEVFNVEGTGSVVGYANYPEASRTDVSSGDIALAMSGSWSPGTWQYSAVLHELGHAVGLQHPHDGSRTLAQNRDSHAFTLQSYNYTSPTATELGPLDEDALEHLYGPAETSQNWNGSWEPASGFVRIKLNNENNRIILSEDASFVAAFNGNDVVYGRGGNDRILGQNGNDILFGGNGTDRLWGQDGNDRLLGGNGNDWLSGGNGNDRLFGGANNDYMIGWTGADILVGGSGNDNLHGHAGSDRLFGDAGNDRLRGYSENDRLSGGAGSDTLTGNQGQDTLFGGADRDVLLGGADEDLLMGQAGRDYLNAGAGDDRLFGGLDHDALVGGAGNDRLFGGEGTDRLMGQTGNDRLWGGGGNDTLYGQAGRDLIAGEEGDDVLVGGPDRDQFIFTEGRDRITDWEDGERITIFRAGNNLAGQTVADVVANAEVVGGNTILDFGGANSLVIAGLTDPSLLTDDLLLR